ncbi:uncharacterized protein LOC124664011 [Lolium rigidum]|uniref:uncharacterized protein LOC124664011 n=1 Tax=Lolium rigidum TaxID=89674 RepID=UPI001F5D9574|nr:uncharacterized protein LOC124664011 [Lolium rigidum]
MSHSVMFSGDGEVDACVGEASGVGDEEVCVGKASVQGDEDACKGEASVVLSGKSRYAVKRRGTAEYPCVKRLRERRLLSFLQDQGFHGAFQALVDKTPVIFRVRHIRLLVEQGRWADALSYLNAYLPPLVKNHTRSRRAQLFHNFLWMHYRFANAVAGNRENQEYLERRYGKNSRSSTLAELRFRRIAYTILASEPHQLVATYDWNQVRQHASFLVDYLANTTPELRRSMPLPSRYMMPQHVLPIGSGRLHWRGHRLVKKQGPKKPDTEAILVALKSLYRDPRAESNNDALEMLVDFLDQTFQAGLRRGCNLSYASQPSVKAGGPDAPDVQSMLGSSTDNSEGHVTSSVNFSVSPFFKLISGDWEVHSQNLGISSVTNAGLHLHLCTD